ncbi:MAG: heavy metal-binding domain-containing protein [Bacteroidota bacterium]
MKKFFLNTIMILAVALVFIACGHSHSHGEGGHTHGDEAQVDQSGPEFTSAYICPMYCKGSGSDKAGKCPTCEMAYVVNKKAKKGHDHSGHDHSGHDHSGHDHSGHDHSGHDHSGHNH